MLRNAFEVHLRADRVSILGCPRGKWYGPGDIRLQEKGSVYGPEEASPEGCFMLNIFADRRGLYPTLLDEPDQEYPAVEPHIMLSRVWNALAEQAERGAAPVPGG